MSPFATPERLFIPRRPQDMRAGIQRLASVVVTDFGEDPQDGALYCFVGRDCEKIEMLRFEVNGRCVYCARPAEGCFRWEHRPDMAGPKPSIGRARPQLPPDGLDPMARILPPPVAANTILQPYKRRSKYK